MIEIHSEIVSPFQENAYFVIDEGTKTCIMIDPGDEADRLLAIPRDRGLDVVKVLLTHAHIDHVGAAAEVCRETGAPLFMHPDEQPLLESLEMQAGFFGLEAPETPEVTGPLAEGDAIEFAGTELRVTLTPGHSPGSVTFVGDGFLISGDVLFAGGIGRTDLPGGDFSTLMDSIQQKLFSFADETVVYPGHGPATTIGEEKRSNPMVRPA